MWRVKWILFVGLVLLATPVAAQTPTPSCIIGVSADPTGTVSFIAPPGFDPFKIYVVMWTEGAASAAAYDLVIPDLNITVFIADVAYGPSGAGSGTQLGPRSSVGLGECATGIDGAPVVVATYTLLIPFFPLPFMVQIDPSDPPEFSDCTEQVFPCDRGSSLVVGNILGDVSASFGQIKSLY